MHFQMNREAERMNRVSNKYLWNLVSVDQRGWADYVGRVELSCDVATHSMTKWSRFMVAY